MHYFYSCLWRLGSNINTSIPWFILSRRYPFASKGASCREYSSCICFCKIQKWINWTFSICSRSWAIPTPYFIYDSSAQCLSRENVWWIYKYLFRVTDSLFNFPIGIINIFSQWMHFVICKYIHRITINSWSALSIIITFRKWDIISIPIDSIERWCIFFFEGKEIFAFTICNIKPVAIRTISIINIILYTRKDIKILDCYGISREILKIRGWYPNFICKTFSRI